MTATFTFTPNPNEEVPEVLAVRESASASWNVQSSFPGGGLHAMGRQKAPTSSSATAPSEKYTLFRSSQKPHLLQVQSSGGSGGSVSNGMGDPVQATENGEISSGSHVKFYRVDGNTVVTDAVTLSASSQESNAETFWSYGAQISDHSVYISSDIEKSFKKGTGPLPSAYTKVDAAGQPLYESQQVAGMGTADTSDDVWKLECIRQRDGFMEVHSAAEWDKVANSYAGAWYGGGTFTTNDHGYVSPRYQWTWSRGTPEVLAASDLAEDRAEIRMGAGSRLPHTVSGDVNLGGQKDGSGITTGSNITVDVSEKASDLPTSLLTAKYNVKWHLPVEARILDVSTPNNPNPSSQTYDAYADQDPNPLSAIGVSTTVTQSPFPVHLQAIKTTGEVVAATATAGGAQWGLAALGVLEPEVVLPLTALAGAVGYQVVEQLPQPNPTVGWENNFLKWQEAVNATRSGDIRIFPASLANDPNALNPDPNVNIAWRSCSVNVRVKFFVKTTNFLRDLYNHNGYNGRVYEFAEKPDGVPVYYGEYHSAGY